MRNMWWKREKRYGPLPFVMLTWRRCAWHKEMMTLREYCTWCVFRRPRLLPFQSLPYCCEFWFIIKAMQQYWDECEFHNGTVAKLFLPACNTVLYYWYSLIIFLQIAGSICIWDVALCGSCKNQRFRGT
jgi:hypothetical protein